MTELERRLCEKNGVKTKDCEASEISQGDLRDVMAISFVTLSESGVIDDVTASEHGNMFEFWSPGVDYAVGHIRRDGDTLYKCLQAHRSQADWRPGQSPSLWKKIGDPTQEYPDWSQPVGAGDAYSIGDKVTHNSKKWLSTVDNNVWEPGVYGWEEVVE